MPLRVPELCPCVTACPITCCPSCLGLPEPSPSQPLIPRLVLQQPQLHLSHVWQHYISHAMDGYLLQVISLALLTGLRLQWSSTACRPSVVKLPTCVSRPHSQGPQQQECWSALCEEPSATISLEIRRRKKKMLKTRTLKAPRRNQTSYRTVYQMTRMAAKFPLEAYGIRHQVTRRAVQVCIFLPFRRALH